jgi:hypothetical protein
MKSLANRIAWRRSDTTEPKCKCLGMSQCEAHWDFVLQCSILVNRITLEDQCLIGGAKRRGVRFCVRGRAHEATTHEGLTLEKITGQPIGSLIAGPVGGCQGAPLHRIALICESLGEGVDYRSLSFSSAGSSRDLPRSPAAAMQNS